MKIFFPLLFFSKLYCFLAFNYLLKDSRGEVVVLSLKSSMNFMQKSRKLRTYFKHRKTAHIAIIINCWIWKIKFHIKFLSLQILFCWLIRWRKIESLKLTWEPATFWSLKRSNHAWIFMENWRRLCSILKDITSLCLRMEKSTKAKKSLNFYGKNKSTMPQLCTLETRESKL